MSIIKDNIKIFKSILIYFAIIILLLLACLFVKYNFMQNVQFFDESILYYIKNNLVNERLTNVMKYLTYFGDSFVFLVITILLFIGLKEKRYALFMTINLIWVFSLNNILKTIFMRPRPVSPFIEISGFSFPSGHSMCSLAFYGLLVFLVFKTIKNKFLKVIFSLLMGVLVLLIGFSRMYLQVHYFSDVIMGFIFGILSLLIFIKILKLVNDEYVEEKKIK